jgi:hypothetical protein
MAKAKKASDALIDLFTPKGKSEGALPSTRTTRMGDIGFDPRYDERVKEQQKLNDLTTTVEKRLTEEVPELYLPDYEGQGFVSSMSDRTAAGGMLTDINGVPLKRPIDLRGGQDYMFENPGQVWASAEDPVRAVMMQAAAAKALTGKDPLYLPWRMAPSGGDFAHMTGETMLSFAESNMGKGDKRSLNSQIKKFIPDWKGIDSPESFDQYRTLPDAERKALKAVLDKNFREKGGLGLGEARLSVSDPNQLTAPEGYLMNVGRIFADKPMIESSGHPSYPKGIPGEGIGRLADDRSLFELNPKVFPREKDIRALLADPSTARTAYENLPDVNTARGIVDPRQPSQTDTRALQMKPYYGILTQELLKKMGFAEGGMVESPPQEAIANTVQNPNAARMLNMDLANLALMQQPQRMSKGGLGRKVGKLLPTPKVNEVAPTQYELAHKLAQERAALPIEEGGLGLPPDNTAMDRAKAMGFDIEAYHGTINPDVMAFDPMSGKGAREGTGSWFSEDPQLASTYAGNMGGTIMPVLIKDRKFAVVDAEGKNWARLTPDTTIYHSNRTDTPASDLIENLFHDYTTTNDVARFAKQEGDKGVRFFNIKDPGARMRGVDEIPETADNLTVFDPTMVRGKFAAFDPFEKNSPDIMKAKGGAVRMAEGGSPDQAEIDRMRLELNNSPVIQATPQTPFQRGIGTLGGYMDRAGQFVSKSIEPLAETHPVKHFLADMFLAGSLKSAGTALQDYTKTSREYTEDNPYKRAPITGSGQAMSLDPRMLDVIGFAQPAASLGIKGVRAGAKAAAPFAKDVGEMASELYMKGDIPLMTSPNMYAVAPDGKPSKVLAPANEIGFYSPTEAAALNLQRKSGQGQAFLNDIMKGENVKSDEISAMGLDTFLKDKKNVTADEVRDYISQNKIQLGETVYDSKGKPNFLEFLKQKGIPEEEALSILNKAEDGIIDSQVAPLRDEYLNLENKSTKFSSYTLPGGENYREIVLTLPVKPLEGATINKTDSGYWRVTYKDGDTAMFRTEKEALDGLGGYDNYQSSHWDEANPLAHLRVSDRVTDGKKTLLVDEVQSDWHQAGREKGYDIKPTPEELTRISQLEQKSASGNISMAERAEWAGLINKREGSIPDAPYKDDWYQLTLRRAIKEAIDGGYDRVALPTGSRVAERFDLSKQIDRIDYNKNDDGTYSMSAIKGGKQIFSREGLDENELSGIVGKDVAKKMVGDEGAAQYDADIADELGVGVVKSLEGLDLKVGGEGMKKYYDEIYPTYLKKLGKKYGAQSGMTKVDVDGKPEPLHYMEITPAMRKEFSTGIHMKSGGKVQFAKSLDAMRHELTKAK